MADTTKSDAGLAIGIGAAIAAAIALARIQKPTAPSAVVTPDAATLNLIIAMTQSLNNIDLDGDSIIASINEVTEAIKGLVIPPGGVAPGVVPNANGITSFRVQCLAVNTAYRLPDCMVPDDMDLLLKGWPTNAGLIYVAGGSLEAININQAWPLLANEQVGYRIDNANRIYVSAQVAGDIVVCTAEQRR